MKADLYNLKNEKVGAVELPDNIFHVRWNDALVQQVLLAQLANKRHPWAHAKDRSEVSGGGRKPWRQKGTGRSRHGSTRSPLWIGGGKAHGPNKERDYSEKVNKKMRRLAIFCVLSKKYKEGNVKVFENFDVEPIKTRSLSLSLRPILDLKKSAKKFDLLMVPDPENKKLHRIARNLPKSKVLSADSLNVYDLMNFKNIFIDQNAVSIIQKTYKLSK